MATNSAIRSTSAIVAWLFAGLLAITALNAAPASAAGPHSPRPRGRRGGPIVSPAPGEHFHGDTVPLVVRAGTAIGAFDARLNGRKVAAQFAVGPHGRRVLRASDSEGLRRGVNVLSVAAWDGEGFRRQKVRFRVVGDEPLTGAGMDLRVPVDSPAVLAGKVDLAPADTGVSGEDWKVVSEPAAADGKPATDEATLEGARTMDPSFKASAPGRYEVELTATSGDGTGADTATIEVVPPSYMVPVKLQVPASSADPQPGIEVGGKIYRSPWMSSAAGGTYQGSADGIVYQAQWQIVALDRETLKEIWNRTYGACHSADQTVYYFCREVDGKVQRVDFAAELRNLGAGAVVLAASHPDTGDARSGWTSPNLEHAVTDVLDEIGFPTESDGVFARELGAVASHPGTVTGIGVPGQGDGTAQWLLSPGGEGMTGYLTPRPTPPNYFEYVSTERPEFDTRAVSNCNGAGECEVTQTVGGERETTVLPVEFGGYLVTAFDRTSLKKLAAETFMTSSDGLRTASTAERTMAMAHFIEKWSENGALLVVTSQHGRQTRPLLFDSATPRADWADLEAAISSIGGTRDSFNRAAQATGGTYTTVGWQGLLEGEAAETWGTGGEGGRLRGVLVRDRQSRFTTTEVSATGAPADALTRLALAPPGTGKWPLSGDAGAERALAYIGEAVTGLGADPRASYTEERITEATDGGMLREIEAVKYPGGTGFSEEQFAAARAELLKEVAAVARVRTYLGELADPAEKAGESSWTEVDQLEIELKNQLEILKNEGKVTFNWVSFVQTLFQLAGIPEGVTGRLKQFIQTAASLSGLSSQFYSRDWAGSPNGGNEILAVNLAKELRHQSELSADSVWGIGNLIVSDPEKLFELGEHAKCAPAQCGEKYAQFAYTVDMADLAKAQVLRARDRTIYEALVPASYPIWDTGLAKNPDLTDESFFCLAGAAASPFEGAPALSHAISLDQLDPASGEGEWRTYISVAHDRSYGWAPVKVLERMFHPVPDNVDAADGGLGIEAAAFMRKAHRSHTYEPGVSCHWDVVIHPGSDVE
jgi:hypothetical protein